MTDAGFIRSLVLHLVVVAALFLLQFVLSDYLVLALTRIMLLGVFAVGYNVLLGYTGLLSLGHALFLGCGIYGAGLTIYHFGWSVPAGFLAGIVAAFLGALLIGFITIRTGRIAFMIATMMFAQAGFLATLYFSNVTGGDQGLSLPSSARSFSVAGLHVDLASAEVRYNLAFALLAVSLAAVFILVRSRKGRVLAAIRENEGRTEMLGFNVFAAKLQAFVISGTISGAAGAAYAILFAYIGSTFASIQYSIEVLLFTLLGGAGTLLGPLLGAAFMTTLIDRIGEWTSASFLVVGFVLIALVLWFPKGILGTVRERWLPWLT
jgi:branched-chain amino acid transport system permease protein